MWTGWTDASDRCGRSEDLLGELAGWVKLETPTTEASAVNRLMDIAEAELARGTASTNATTPKKQT